MAALSRFFGPRGSQRGLRFARKIGPLATGSYVLTYAFDGPARGTDLAEVVRYWEGRRFRCATDGRTVVGRRGSLGGNLFSYDMLRLRCDLHVQLDEGRGIRTRLMLDGSFQVLSEWSFAELAFEQVLFRRALLRLPAPAHLERFRAESRRAAVVGTLSLTFLGRKLPRYWQQVIHELSAPAEPPVVERSDRR
jgi:hypothetical protein